MVEAWDVMVANNLFGFMAIILVLVQVALFNTGVSSVHESVFPCADVSSCGGSWYVMGSNG